MSKRQHVYAEIAAMFDEFWKAYPRRHNSGRYKAKQIFNRLLLDGFPADKLINAARQYADYCQKTKKLGTEYVAMAQTWLNQRRWEDYEPEEIKPTISSDDFARLKAKYDAKIKRSA